MLVSKFRLPVGAVNLNFSGMKAAELTGAWKFKNVSEDGGFEPNLVETVNSIIQCMKETLETYLYHSLG